MSKSRAKPRWAIIVHGGAKNITPGQEQAHRRGCLAALTAGQSVLERDGSALEAAEAAVRALEDDPTFNAGYGSVLNAQGEVECDAAIMDGATLEVGAVAAVRSLRHPISVAATLLHQKPVLLVAEGAELFARSQNAELCDPADLVCHSLPERAMDPGCDTVGCVALDFRGRLAAATSTGGLTGCHPGRVGDSPLPGCGLYADDAIGGVSLSGEGESLIRTTLAARVMHALERATPGEAIRTSLSYLARVGGEAGLIVIDAHGQVDWGHNSGQFAVAYATAEQPARAFVQRAEDSNKDTE